MSQELINKLQSYWFSQKEALVYLVSLELWTSLASTISRKSSINRTSVYTILDDLKKRWLISEVIQNDTKYYSALNPENILNNLEKRASSFKEILPDLLNIDSKYWNKAKIKYFEWLEWLKTAYYEVLNEGYNMTEPFLSIYGTNENIDKNIVKFFEEEFVKERNKCPTKSLAITTIKGKKDDYFNIDKSDTIQESITIEHPMIDIADDIMIYGWNKLAIFMFSKNELSAIIIESQSLFNTFKWLFYLIWDIYKKNNLSQIPDNS